MTDTREKQILALIDEVKTADKANLLEIITIAPKKNYIKFKIETDKKKSKKLSDSLKERYDLLRFMWVNDGQHIFCMAFYYSDDSC